MENSEMFKKIYCAQINRPGAPELLRWLQSTDFFTAPASTRFHGAYEGGLVEHSLNVYEEFQSLGQTSRFEEIADSMNASYSEMEETAAICTLLHDICKANYYAVDFKNQKNTAGEWEKVPFYTVKDHFPFGHGEKSVFLISRFMRLTDAEALAIRWHMGTYDESARGGSRTLSAAMAFSPLVYELHAADMRATQAEQREERT